MDSQMVNCESCGKRMPLQTITAENPRGLCSDCLTKEVGATDVSGGSGTPGKVP